MINRDKIKQVQRELHDAEKELNRISQNPFTLVWTKIDLIRRIEWCNGYLKAVKDQWEDHDLQELSEK